jgi:DNA repair protein RecO
MLRRKKTEGIVLKKRILLHKDTILTVFTSEFGKLSLYAKGIRTLTSRRAPHIQTGNLIVLFVQERNHKNYLAETQLISAFSQIKNNEKKMNALYFFFFILERLLPENQKEETVYCLVKKFLVKLSNLTGETGRDLSLQQIITSYTNQLLQHLGYEKENKEFEELILSVQSLIHEKIHLRII